MQRREAQHSSPLLAFSPYLGEWSGIHAVARSDTSLLGTTTGRGTGKERTWPVGYLRDGDAYVIVASNGGLATHPAWYHNLTAAHA